MASYLIPSHSLTLTPACSRVCTCLHLSAPACSLRSFVPFCSLAIYSVRIHRIDQTGRIDQTYITYITSITYIIHPTLARILKSTSQRISNQAQVIACNEGRNEGRNEWNEERRGGERTHSPTLCNGGRKEGIVHTVIGNSSNV